MTHSAFTERPCAFSKEKKRTYKVIRQSSRPPESERVKFLSLDTSLHSIIAAILSLSFDIFIVNVSLSLFLLFFFKLNFLEAFDDDERGGALSSFSFFQTIGSGV